MNQDEVYQTMEDMHSTSMVRVPEMKLYHLDDPILNDRMVRFSIPEPEVVTFPEEPAHESHFTFQIACDTIRPSHGNLFLYR